MRQEKFLALFIISLASLAFLLGGCKHFISGTGFLQEPQYVFTWSPEVQSLVPYSLRLEMTFRWIGEDLSIIAKLNDYAEFGGYLGIVFFELATYSTYDKAYALFVHNETIDVGVLSPGGYQFGFPNVIPKPSPYHTCTYNNETGYTTFDILFHNHNPDKTHIHVTWVKFVGGAPVGGAYVRFRFQPSHG